MGKKAGSKMNMGTAALILVIWSFLLASGSFWLGIQSISSAGPAMIAGISQESNFVLIFTATKYVKVDVTQDGKTTKMELPTETESDAAFGFYIDQVAAEMAAEETAKEHFPEGEGWKDHSSSVSLLEKKG